MHSDQAVSYDNGTQLDGNQNGTNDTPVAPNKGNDFVWKLSCVQDFEFHDLNVVVDVTQSGQKVATKSYNISGYTCGVTTDNSKPPKINGATWALSYTYTIMADGKPPVSRQEKVKMQVPDKMVNQDGLPIVLVPNNRITDPSGLKISLAGLYNSDPTQMFVKATVSGPGAAVYTPEQATQLIDMTSRPPGADSSDCK